MIDGLTRYIVLRLNLETTKAKPKAVTRPQRVLPILTKFYITNMVKRDKPEEKWVRTFVRLSCTPTLSSIGDRK